MLEKVKRIPNYLLKRKVFLSIAFLGILSLLIPFRAHSIFGLDVGETIALRFASWILRFWIWITKFVTEISGQLLNWIISPRAISLDYTNPSGNPIIEVGLGITQGFANIFLVLVLLYIAIATILRLQEYQAQKLLPIFILVALLVNFAPVVAGVVVDASNIVMEFFVSSLSPDEFSIFMSNKMDHLISAISEAKTSEEIRDPFVQMVMIAIIINVLTMVFILYFFLFLARYIAIWMLVILSPLAFVALILPNTRNYFKEWWKQLINWSFIGAIGGFFMYLSLSMVVLIQNDSSRVNINIDQPDLNTVLPYIVPIVFLVAGFIYSLKGAAAGSSIAIGMAKRAPRLAFGAARKTIRGAGKSADWIAKKAKLNQRKILGGRMTRREAISKVTSNWEQKRGLRWFLPDRLRQYAEYKPAVEEGRNKAKSYSSKVLANRLWSKADVHEDALGNLLEMAERNDGQDIFDGARRSKWFRRVAIEKAEKEIGRSLEVDEKKNIDHNKFQLSDQEIMEDPEYTRVLARPMEIANQAGMLGGELLRKDPRLVIAAVRAGLITGPDGKDLTEEEATTKYVNESRDQHIAKWEPEVLDDPKIIRSMLAKFDRDRWLAVSRKIKGGQTRAMTSIDKDLKRFIDDEDNDIDMTGRTKESVFNTEYKEMITKKLGGDGFWTGIEIDNRMTGANWRPGGTEAGWKPEKSRSSSPAQAVGIKPPKDAKYKTSSGGVLYEEDIKESQAKAIKEREEKKKTKQEGGEYKGGTGQGKKKPK